MNAIALAIVEVAWIAFTAWVIYYTGNLWFTFLLIAVGFMHAVPKDK